MIIQIICYHHHLYHHHQHHYRLTPFVDVRGIKKEKKIIENFDDVMKKKKSIQKKKLLWDGNGLRQKKKYINGLLKVIELDFLDLHERMNMKKLQQNAIKLKILKNRKEN